MSQDNPWLRPWAKIRKAAAIMHEKNVAALPVVVDERPVGILTDRNIVVHLLPRASDAGERPVSDVMITDPLCCYTDQSVVEAAAIMGEEQIKHLLVLDRSEELVGILSVEDIAEKASEELAGQVLGEIVEKRSPRRSRRRFTRPE